MLGFLVTVGVLVHLYSVLCIMPCKMFIKLISIFKYVITSLFIYILTFIMHDSVSSKTKTAKVF